MGGAPMLLAEVMEALEQHSPLSFAEDWDNSGLMCGRKNKTIQKILLAVDATDEVIDEAILSETDLLLTHHPLIFPNVSKITEDNLTGRRLLKLIASDVACYAMHTNFDVIGMADEAADRLRLTNREVLEVLYEDNLSKEGIGRVGRLAQEMSLKDCAEFVKEVFLIDSVRVYGNPESRVSFAAISPGSGKKMIKYARKANANVIITGDIDHHEGLDAVAEGVAVIDAGRYEIEKIFVNYMKDFLLRTMPEMNVICASQTPPFVVI